MIELVKARLSDISAMQALVVHEVKDGVILNRSDDEVATNIRSYVLAKEEGALVGYTALHVHSTRLAEIRSLIVCPINIHMMNMPFGFLRHVDESATFCTYPFIALPYDRSHIVL